MDFISKTFEENSMTPESEFRASVVVCDKMYYLKNNSVHITCDSQTLWNHLLLENEVQISKADSEINVWYVLYNCTKYYSVTSMHELIDGQKAYYVVEMVACDKENEFSQLTLKINAKTLHLTELKLHDNDGKLHLFTILRFQDIKKLPKEFFTFSIKNHPTVEIVDLR